MFCVSLPFLFVPFELYLVDGICTGGSTGGNVTVSYRETECCLMQLYRYKRKRAKLVTRTAVARLPTTWGSFQAYSYRSELDGIEHLALVKVFILTFA
jgi:hypothetical protein